MVSKRRNKRTKRRRWYRMDLHLHTPASEDWRDADVTFLDWLQAAEAKELDIVAMTDHNTVAGYARFREELRRLQWLEETGRILPEEQERLNAYRELLDKILVLPGFEFTAALGFHILGIFPPDTPIRKLEFLLLRLGIPADKLDAGSTTVGATEDVLTAYRLIREAGGLVIAAHANSTHGVMMRGLGIGGQTRIAYTQDENLHALEVTDLGSRGRNSTARFFNGTKPEYPRRMHLLQGSDAHSLEADPKEKNRLGIGDRPTEISLEEPSFEAIKAVLESDEFDRIRKPRAKATKDPLTEAQRTGESEIFAFHKRLSAKGGEQERIMRDIVAMANTRGGRIIVGASAKRTEPPIGIQHPRVTLKQLQEEVKRRVFPPLEPKFTLTNVRGKHIILIDVPEGKEKPYALDNQFVYVRRGRETRLATRDELLALIEGHTVQNASSPVSETTTAPSAPLAIVEAKQGGTSEPSHNNRRRSKKTPESTPPEEEKFPPPSDGVEIVGVEERRGTRRYIIRDLRNGSIVSDVTRESAKRLWEYAIQRHETEQVDPDHITWLGNLGIWHVEHRAGKMRYDLVQRFPDGKYAVYYGVTEDGFTGPWADLLPIAKEMAALQVNELTHLAEERVGEEIQT